MTKLLRDTRDYIGDVASRVTVERAINAQWQASVTADREAGLDANVAAESPRAAPSPSCSKTLAVDHLVRPNDASEFVSGEFELPNSVHTVLAVAVSHALDRGLPAKGSEQDHGRRGRLGLEVRGNV